MTEREQFEAWANDYGLRAEPNYSKHTEADCWAAWQAARAQPAQAVPLLSDEEICDLLDAARVPDLPHGYEDVDLRIAHIVQKAVLKKVGIVGKEGA